MVIYRKEGGAVKSKAVQVKTAEGRLLKRKKTKHKGAYKMSETYITSSYCSDILPSSLAPFLTVSNGESMKGRVAIYHSIYQSAKFMDLNQRAVAKLRIGTGPA